MAGELTGERRNRCVEQQKNELNSAELALLFSFAATRFARPLGAAAALLSFAPGVLFLLFGEAEESRDLLQSIERLAHRSGDRIEFGEIIISGLDQRLKVRAIKVHIGARHQSTRPVDCLNDRFGRDESGIFILE